SHQHAHGIREKRKIRDAGAQQERYSGPQEYQSTRGQNRKAAANQRENSRAANQVAQIKAQVDQRENPTKLAPRRQAAMLAEIGGKPVDTEVQARIHED